MSSPSVCKAKVDRRSSESSEGNESKKIADKNEERKNRENKNQRSLQNETGEAEIIKGMV
jgi:hypothetical protein